MKQSVNNIEKCFDGKLLHTNKQTFDLNKFQKNVVWSKKMHVV